MVQWLSLEKLLGNLSNGKKYLVKTKFCKSGEFAVISTSLTDRTVRQVIENTKDKKNGINSFDAITAMFEGKPYTVESLNLVEHLDYKEMYHPSAPPVPSELNKTPPDQ